MNIFNFKPQIKHNWKLDEVLDLFNSPLNDLLIKAQISLREFFEPNKIQASTLLSIKTGGCPEDCKYCPQSANYKTEVKAEKLLDKEKILASAKNALQAGATRFCMGAAWRSPKERDMPELIEVIEEVKSLGLETCMTLGMLTENQATRLADAGLDYYNHNIDTSEKFYKEIITTRTYEDRLNTLENVRKSGMKVCCGGILGMGENLEDRANMLITLANMPKHPESVPINMLVKVKGTPFENTKDLNSLEFIRTIAIARIMMPASYVRLSAGREEMSSETQALCYMAGANSIFYGDKLLTTPNPDLNEDLNLLKQLGIEIEETKQCKAA
jgi:biotin synthase